MQTQQSVALRDALHQNAVDLLRYFQRRVANHEDAADLLGDTMMAAWRRVDALPSDDPTQQRMWLYGIASRTLANHRRGRRRRTALIDRLCKEMASATPSEPDHAEVAAVRDAVQRLRPDHREVVILVHWDGMNLNEAAEILAVNPSTMRSRYAAARTALRTSLEDNGPPRRSPTQAAAARR